jgi:hypothetical protein
MEHPYSLLSFIRFKNNNISISLALLSIMSNRLTSSVRDMATCLLPRLKDDDRHHDHFRVPSRHLARMSAAFVAVCALSWLMTAGHARNAAAASQIMHNHANCNAEANRLYWRQRRQADDKSGQRHKCPEMNDAEGKEWKWMANRNNCSPGPVLNVPVAYARPRA